MNNEFDQKNNPSPDAEIEARIVAWVAGEASAFESADLERLIATRPDLADFKRRMEEARELARAALRSDSTPMKMSATRRAELLKAIGGAAVPTKAENTVAIPTPSRKRRNRYWVPALATGLAAAAALYIAWPRDRFLEAHKEENLVVLEMPKGGAGADKKALSAAKRAENPDVAQEMTDREKAFQDAVKDAEMRKEERKEATQYADATLLQVHQQQAKGLVQAAPAPMELPAPEMNQPADPAPPATELQKSSDRRDEASDNAAIVLSPFVVGNSDNKGPGANDTLAGTRVRTSPADVASSVGVVTNQFLKDTGAANNSNSPLNYAPNNEIGGNAGNFGGQNAQNASANTNGFAMDKFEVRGSLVTDDDNSGAAGKSAAPEKAKEAPRDRPSIGGLRFDPGLFGSLATKVQTKGGPEADLPLPRAAKPAEAPVDRSEVDAAKNPVSTFSLHVSDVSFRLAVAALARSEAIDPDTIRPEEFINAFNYGDPAPTMAEKVSCRIEQSAHPFLQQRNLVRIAVRVPATGRDAAQPLRLTVLLDTSGSMEREDRSATARAAMQSLVSLLGPNDRLTLIGFARQSHLLADDVAGNDAAKVLEIAAHTPSEGGTNLDEALKLAGDLARRHFTAGAQNRVVVLTDGAANLGDADPARLAGAVASLRDQGIAFDACGVGLDGLDDTMLERLTRQGGGRYYVLNSPTEADAGFARQLAGAFRPAAENVKLQVRFNPARVASYRLIGFEQHRLREQDFRNDAVAAAPLAAEEAAVAVYQVEPRPEGDGELGEVYVRFRDTATNTMVERSWTLPFDAHAPAFDRALPSMQLAGFAALIAEKLQGGAPAEAIRLDDLASIASHLRTDFPDQPRVLQLVDMFQQLRRADRR
ncbi:MAG TPA: von Willebrand factor type A domain-containing protein [Candidatus Didemnitutus sp.]|nr:von Willebrand factor type A domain-containing protein [Candidatus Didemnitutus sp.]